jgi:hypothetical protein
MRAVVIVVALGATAAAAPAPQAWVGQVQPAGEALVPCTDCTLSPVQRAGRLVVLPPKDVAPPAGDVVLVQPFVGIVQGAHVDKGHAALAWFLADRRDGDNGVLVLPAGTLVHLVPAAAADVAQIKAALLRNEVLEHIAKAVAKLEVGAIDVDGDGKADFAVTYGCAAWGDGACQLRGQFMLARRAGKWVELE